MIAITQKAAKQLKIILDESRANNPEACIRFGIKNGGCAGHKHLLAIIPRPGSDDKVFESNGVQVFVNPLQLRFVDGAEIDYKGKFLYTNPNVKPSCNCGTSFELK